MKRNFDLREYKKELRDYSKEYRRALSAEDKLKKDTAICNQIQRLHQYQRAKLVLVYISTPIEVDTMELITAALDDGKRVAAPRCIHGTRLMEFYEIKSLDDLEPRTFGVLEPKIECCKKLMEFSNSICIVPALIYDLQGYRIGYGAGYYDRFLAKYHGTTIGTTYTKCIRRKIIHGKFDLPVSILVTERYSTNIKPKPKPGRDSKNPPDASGGQGSKSR